MALIHEMPPRSSLSERQALLPAAILVFVTVVAAVLILWVMQSRQASARVAGLGVERASEALLPWYLTMSQLRMWMLLAPSVVSFGVVLKTGVWSVLLIPAGCVVIMLLAFPTRGRFERFVTDCAGVRAS